MHETDQLYDFLMYKVMRQKESLLSQNYEPPRAYSTRRRK